MRQNLPALRTALLTLAVALGAAPPTAAAQNSDPTPADQSQAETPADIIVALRAGYRARLPLVEEVRIAASAGGAVRAETVRVYADADGLAALQLGPYLVNASNQRILMAHTLDAGSYVTIADLAAMREGLDAPPNTDGDTPNHAYRALRSFLPPVNALALELVFGDEADTLSAPFAFVRNVEWTTVEREGLTATLRGRFPNGHTELRIDTREQRVRSARVDYSDGQRSLRYTHRLVTGPDAERSRWEIDTDGREELMNAGMLRARPGDITAGRRLPPLDAQDPGPIINLTQRDPPAVPRPGLVVLFDPDRVDTARRLIDQATESGLAALAIASITLGEDTPEPEATERDLRTALREVWERLDRRDFVFSIDPDRTIKRFIPDEVTSGRCVAVAVDREGVVRGVYPIGETTADRMIARAVSHAVARIDDTEEDAPRDAPSAR